MEPPTTNEDPEQVVTRLESEIATLTKNLEAMEMRLAEIDYEINQLFKNTFTNIANGGVVGGVGGVGGGGGGGGGGGSIATTTTDLSYIFSEEKKLQEEEDQIYVNYKELRANKEKLITQLRTQYSKVIKEQHKKRSIMKDANIKPVDFSISQLTHSAMYKNEEGDISTFVSSSLFILDKDITLVKLLSSGGGSTTTTTSSSSHNPLVYLGTCRGKQVVVKVLQKFDDKEKEEFKKEVQILKDIPKFSHLTLFMGACNEDGKYKFVMEYAQNGSLDSQLEEKKQQFSWRRKVQMFQEICLGMNWLHKQAHVLHLNLKPSNVLFSSDWQIRISDYSSGHRPSPSHTSFYTAPEFAQGQTPTTKCDVYSYGILCWYIIHEKDPSSTGVVRGGKLPLSPTYQHVKSVIDLLERCCNVNPSSRPEFEDLIKEDKWENITSEMFTQKHGEGDGTSTFWSSQFESATTVPWTDFSTKFSAFLEIPPDVTKKVEWRCLAALMEVEKNGGLTKVNFERFVDFFGPVRKGPKEGMIWLEEIKSLLSQKWFHGDVDGKMAQDRIAAQKKSGIYQNSSGLLLRFSTTDSTFTLTFRHPKDQRFYNQRLTNPVHFRDIPSLIVYVNDFMKKNKIDPTDRDRIYQSIFDSH